jgi:hypothetical protein
VLNLPPEIRNAIYQYVFERIDQTATLAITRPDASTRSDRQTSSCLSKLRNISKIANKRSTSLALLQTCHQIRNEAAS